MLLNPQNHTVRGSTSSSTPHRVIISVMTCQGGPPHPASPRKHVEHACLGVFYMFATSPCPSWIPFRRDEEGLPLLFVSWLILPASTWWGGSPLLFVSFFPLRHDEEGLPLLFVSFFPLRHDEEGLPLLFVSLFPFRHNEEGLSLPSVSLFHFVLNFLYIILSKVYLVVCTPGLLKPVTCTHETHTHVHGYRFPRVQVQVQLEIPGGYPCHSLTSTHHC